MSSTNRKVLGDMDPNRLQHAQNKLQDRRRRRVKATSKGSSEHSSLASYVDDSEFDFLSNPEKTTQQLNQLFSQLQSNEDEETTEATWNSFSKTPKLSNVSAVTNERKNSSNKDFLTSTLSFQDHSTFTATLKHKSSVNSADNSQKAVHRLTIIKEVGEKMRQQPLTVELSSAFDRWKKFRKRVQKNTDVHKLLQPTERNVQSSLETIEEGAVEQESNSPMIIHDTEEIPSNLCENSTIDTRHSRYNESESPQVKHKKSSNDHLRDVDNTSDMEIDESSDDESFDLNVTSCLPIHSDTEATQSIEKNTVLRAAKENSKCETLSLTYIASKDEEIKQLQLQGDFIRNFDCHKSTPTHIFALKPRDSTKISTPYAASCFSTKHAKRLYNINSEQLVPPFLPVNASEQYAKIPTDNKAKQKCILSLNTDKLNVFVSDAKTCKSLLVQQNASHCKKIDETHLTSCSVHNCTNQNGTNQNGTIRPRSTFSMKNETNRDSPIDKKVWQAMMRMPETNSSCNLIGMVIKTPVRMLPMTTEDAQSVDSSELTHDSELTLGRDHITVKVDIQQTHQTSPLESEGCHTTTDAKKHFCSDQSIKGKETKHLQHTLLNVYSEERKKENSEQLALTPKFEFLENNFQNSCNNEMIKSEDVEHRFKQLLQTPARASTLLTQTQTPAYMFKVKNLTPSNRYKHFDSNTQIAISCKKHSMSISTKPIIWTAENAGRKFKEFGVNAAPVFRLSDKTYYQHPPLPPGWTVAVSRSHDIPYYIHPDFGTTFYPPIPLPSYDGDIVGTTMLYHADTPLYRAPVDSALKSGLQTCPSIFPAPNTSSIRWSAETSAVISHNSQRAKMNTPLGALVVATNTSFSESQNGIVSNEALQQQINGIPLSISEKNDGMQIFDDDNAALASTSSDSTASTDSPAQNPIPREIEIMRSLEDSMDDDKFTRDLYNTSKNSLLKLEIAHQMHSKSTVSREVDIARSVHNETHENLHTSVGKDTSIEENLQSVLEADDLSQSQTLILRTEDDLDASSLDWTAEISEGSCKTEAINRYRSKSPNDWSPDAITTINSNTSDKRALAMTLELSHAADRTKVPLNIAFASGFQNDEMSLLQCSPQESLSVKIDNPNDLGYAVEQSTLLVECGEAMFIPEDNSNISMDSQSDVSNRSIKSRVSIRSTNPKLPLCSLQNLRANDASKKRKRQNGNKLSKRHTTGKAVPISA